jgi:hypothetical protein
MSAAPKLRLGEGRTKSSAGTSTGLSVFHRELERASRQVETLEACNRDVSQQQSPSTAAKAPAESAVLARICDSLIVAIVLFPFLLGIFALIRRLAS